jgi:hypothetical protein
VIDWPTVAAIAGQFLVGFGIDRGGLEAIDKAAPPHVDVVRQLVFDGVSGDQVATLESFVSRVLSRLEGRGDEASEERASS